MMNENKSRIYKEKLMYSNGYCVIEKKNGMEQQENFPDNDHNSSTVKRKKTIGRVIAIR